MADESDTIVEKLKERGLTCGKLKVMERKELREAETYRKWGFDGLAKAQENSANTIKSLRSKVCKLR